MDINNIDEEELTIQINAIEKLLNNPNAMICLSEQECLSLENGLLNLLGEIKDEIENRDKLTEIVEEKIEKIKDGKKI